MTPRVVLIGLPGTGKSTSGRRLAKIMCVPFVDSDELVEAAEGRSVAEIFATGGEAAFRTAEHAAIAACLAGDFDGVLSLGGGAVTHAPTRAAVVACGVPVAMLRAELATLLARVGDGRTRPLLAADPQARLQALAAERTPIYEALATLIADTDGRTPGQVAAHVAARMHQMGVLS
ncbi:MAG TPA: shikimate kinase [Jatrophihabitans sp.]|jgi:shikimate kinase